MKSLKKLLAISLLTLLSSCLVGPRYKRPESVAPPDQYRNADSLATDSSAAAADSAFALIHWDTLFNDPVLKQLVDSVLTGNPDMKIITACTTCVIYFRINC